MQMRLPIHKGVMRLILQGVHKLFIINTTQPYLEKLYSAIFMAAYYGLLRIGEVTKSPHVILAKNVHIGTNKDKILFVLEMSKTHTKGEQPQIVKIYGRKVQRNTNNPVLGHACPFATLHSYIAIRRDSIEDEEQFFIFQDHTAVTPSHVRKMLKLALTEANLDPNGYFFHCFRSGRVGHLLDLGVSIETIKKLGRWKSNAVFTCLRN